MSRMWTHLTPAADEVQETIRRTISGHRRMLTDALEPLDAVVATLMRSGDIDIALRAMRDIGERFHPRYEDSVAKYFSAYRRAVLTAVDWSGKIEHVAEATERLARVVGFLTFWADTGLETEIAKIQYDHWRMRVEFRARRIQEHISRARDAVVSAQMEWVCP